MPAFLATEMTCAVSDVVLILCLLSIAFVLLTAHVEEIAGYVGRLKEHCDALIPWARSKLRRVP
jgi:hypothetical protein